MVWLVIVVLVILSINKWSQYELIIKDQETNEEYLKIEVDVGDRLELTWIHSVELTPWSEVLEVVDGRQLKLVETRFQSFGAGVPYETEGNVLVQDGYTIMTDLHQMFTSYRWIHSHQAQFTLTRNGENIFLPKDLPHHHRIEMLIGKRWK